MKEYKLSKNAWHVRLMKFIWGWDHNDFTNMCPYFWISFVNLIIIIPYTLVVYPSDSLVMWLIKQSGRKSVRSRQEEIKKFMAIIFDGAEYTDKDVKRFFKIWTGAARSQHYAHIRWHIVKRMRSEKMNMDYVMGLETDNPFLQAVNEYAERKQIEQMKKDFSPSQLVPYAKWVGCIVMGLLTALITFIFVSWLISIWGIIDWLAILQWILMCIGGGVVIILIIWGAVVFLETHAPKLMIPLNWMGDKLSVAFGWIGSLFGLIADMYNNYCPGLKWK